MNEKELAAMGLEELYQLGDRIAAERATVEREQGGHDLEARAAEWAIVRMKISKTPQMAGPPGAFWYYRERG